ncbi:hypothetical protein Emed_006661 [Eimeria media]
MASIQSVETRDFLSLESPFDWKSAESPRQRWGLGTAATRKEHTLLEASFAGVLVALTFAYFLWGCFRFLSLVPNGDASPSRLLATGGSDRGECVKNPDESESDQGEGRERRRRRVRTRRQDVPESSEKAQKASSSNLFAEGWGRRKMPPEWRERAQRELHRLRELAAVCAAAHEVMSAEDGLKLTFHVAMMALMELSGYCYVPQDIQKFRAKAGDAVCGLIQNAINRRSWQTAAAAGGYTLVFAQVQEMTRKICREPPLHEQVSARKFKGKFIMHWGLSRRAVTLLKNNISNLLSMRYEPAVLAEGVRTVLLVAEALWQVRKEQVAGDTFFRHWFIRCHRELSSPTILLTQSDFDAAVRDRSRSVDDQAQEIIAAVAQAGGSVNIPGYSTSISPLREGLLARASTESSPASRDETQQLPEAQQQAESEAAPQRRRGLVLTTFEESVRLSRELQQAPAASQEQYELLGARPRAQARREENLEAARALGWGAGQMPIDVLDSMRALVTLISKVASECFKLFGVLEPAQAFSLAVVVTSLTTVNLAGLAAVPSRVQHSREEAGRTLLGLVQATLDTVHTPEPARQTENERRLRALQVLIAHVTRPLQPQAPLDVEHYLVHMMETWRLTNLSVRKALGLVRSLRSGKTSEEGERILAALEALFQTRKLQLLADPTLGEWFAACHASSTPGLLFTQEEHDAAARAGALPVGQKMAQLNRAVEQAQRGLPLRGRTKKPPASAKEGPLPIDPRSPQPPAAPLGDVRGQRPSRLRDLSPLQLPTFPLPPEAHRRPPQGSSTSLFPQAARPFGVEPVAPFWREPGQPFGAYWQAEEERPYTPLSVVPPESPSPVVSVQLPPEFSIPFPTRFYPTFLEPSQQPQDEPLPSAWGRMPHYTQPQVVRRPMWSPSGGVGRDSGRVDPSNVETEGSGGPQQGTEEQGITLLSTMLSSWKAFSEDKSSKE